MSLLTLVGSKKHLLPYLNQIISQYLDMAAGNDTIYVEPFLGSGSVLINILEQYPVRFQRYLVADANEVLIEVFKQIKSNPASLIISLEQIQNLYCSLDMDERKYYFSQTRARFNDLNLNRVVDPNRELLIASLFIFLSKTCFRGVFRVNQNDELVCAFGYLKSQPKIVNPELIIKLHRLLNDHEVQFYCWSYDKLDLGDEQVLLYLDPPYYNTLDKYTSDGFDETPFVEYLETVTNNANCKVILSSSNNFEGVISEKEQINLPKIITLSVKDLTNTTKPAKNTVEIIGTNL